jgi:hypothetical protein
MRYVCKAFPITVAALFKALAVYAHSNVGVLLSSPTRGTDMCVYSLLFTISGR